MHPALTRRTALLATASAALGGCARDRPVVLDRQAMAGVKRIGLPVVGVPRSPDVIVVNGMSTQMAGFGLIGAIGSLSGSIVRGNRSDAVVRMMAAQRFDPGPAMTELLAASLGAKGFTVVPLFADPKRQFMPDVVPALATCDAVLDCYVSGYGFSAHDDSDSSPYRAVVAVRTRLVGKGGVVLMQDAVGASSGPGPAGNAAENAASPPRDPAGTKVFPSFSDAEKDPAVAVAALRAVFADAAAGVVRRVS